MTFSTACISVSYTHLCPVTVENEKDMEKALEDVNKAECNALAVSYTHLDVYKRQS